jgi:hypothetical protein
MSALCRTSGVNSLLFIFPDGQINLLVVLLNSLITGDSIRTESNVVATHVVETAVADSESGEIRKVAETTSSAVPKLIPQTHTPLLRANRGLTLTAVSLLVDILLRVPSALVDYKGVITFLSFNLDAAVTGNQSTSSATLTGKDAITQGVAQYTPLQCGIDRIDDVFVLKSIEALTLLLRASRLKHESSNGAVESKHSLLHSFLELSNPANKLQADNKSSGSSSASAVKLLQQTMQVREIVSSKLLAMGESLLLLGAGTTLRPVLRLMVRTTC